MLALLVLQPERSWSAAEIEDATGMSRASVHRELQRAASSGVVVRDSNSRPHRFTAATSSPLFDPLFSLLERTVGVEASLGEILRSTEGVEAAAIHGSWVRGPVGPESDVDVLVVGAPDGQDLRLAIRAVQRRVGRRIDLTIADSEELRSRRLSGDGFVARLLDGPLISLIGDVHETLT